MRFILIVIPLLLSGCAIVPENIQVADDTALVSYQQVVSTGDAALEKPARWGGIIAGVNNKEGFSEVEIVHFSLNSYGKPSVANESSGRFKVRVDGFLDPVVFEPGRTVTFIGKVNEPIEGLIGEQPYLYPLIAADSYHLWKKETVYDVSSVHFDAGYGWYSPFWGPRFYGHPFGFRHGPSLRQSRVRVVERAPRSNPSSVTNPSGQSNDPGKSFGSNTKQR